MQMGVGPQEHLDIIKRLKNASNKALEGHLGSLKHTFKRKRTDKGQGMVNRAGLSEKNITARVAIQKS